MTKISMKRMRTQQLPMQLFIFFFVLSGIACNSTIAANDLVKSKKQNKKLLKSIEHKAEKIEHKAKKIEHKIEKIEHSIGNCRGSNNLCSSVSDIKEEIQKVQNSIEEENNNNCCTYGITQSAFDISGTYTISAPGVYCLDEDVSGFIYINHDDVTLRCCDHKITNTVNSNGAIRIEVHTSNVVIQDGCLEATGNGITIGLGCTFIKLLNMRTQYCANGFYFNGDLYTGIYKVEMYNCAAQFSTNDGFYFAYVYSAIIEYCIAIENGGALVGNGFNFLTGHGYMVLNCISNNNNLDGFRIGSSGEYGLQIKDSEFLSNKAVNNIAYGFNLYGGADGSSIDTFSNDMNNFIECKSFFMGNNSALNNGNRTTTFDYNPSDDNALQSPCCIGKGSNTVFNDDSYWANIKSDCAQV